MVRTLVLASQSEKADASIIFLHGLSASAEDILPVATMLQQADYGSTKLRFVLPSADQMPVTLNDKMVMPSWYDIIQLDPPRVDCNGVQKSLHLLDELIKQEIAAGIDSSRIILMGYSQGGSVVLAYGMEMPRQVGGLVGLSCFLPPCERRINPANQATSFLLMHGTSDETVPFIYARATAEELAARNYQYELKTYPHGHHIGEQQIRHLAKWISLTLKC